MRLEHILQAGRQCPVCMARMFFYDSPPRYICLREREHEKYTRGSIPGRRALGATQLVEEASLITR